MNVQSNYKIKATASSLEPPIRFLESATQSLLAELIRSRSIRILACMGFWTIVAFASALHWWYYPQGSYPYTWWQLFMGKVLVWYSFGLVAPLVFWLGNRLRLDTGPRLRHAFSLLAFAVIVTFLYLLVYTQWILLVIGAGADSNEFASMLGFVIAMHSTYYFLAFWVLIAIEHTVAYYQRFVERERLAAQLQAQLAKAQLERLKSQLHPHFLFNTLNTVSSLVLSDKSNEAYDALVDLAELLRISLDRHDQEFVSLAEEVEFNQLYLKLMSRRFPNQLKIKWSIEPEALDAQLPNMILQPLIENAVKYSVDQKSSISLVAIAAEVAAGKLVVAVTNSRPELTPTAANGFGIGLSQVEQRLTHHYSDRYEFTSDSSDKSHFRVGFAIPYSSQPHGILKHVEDEEEIHSDHR